MPYADFFRFNPRFAVALDMPRGSKNFKGRVTPDSFSKDLHTSYLKKLEFNGIGKTIMGKYCILDYTGICK
jgi:hypothetical protein